jgi:uncharacterized protein (DUF983 family)
MSDRPELSSFEKILLGIDQPESKPNVIPLQKGENCPRCKLGVLDYNGLLQLECSACGFVSAEGGGCT